MPAIFMEDCYAGILAQKINLSVRNIPNRGVSQFDGDYNIDQLDMCLHHKTNIFSNAFGTEERQHKLWHKIKLQQQIINFNCSLS